MASLYRIESFELENFYVQYREIQIRKRNIKLDHTFPHAEVREMIKEQNNLYDLIVNRVSLEFPELMKLAETYLVNDQGKKHFYIHVVKALLDWPEEGIIEVKSSFVDYCYFNDSNGMFERIHPVLKNLVQFIENLEAQKKSTNRYRKSDEFKYFIVKDAVIVKQLSPKVALTKLNQFITNNESTMEGRG